MSQGSRPQIGPAKSCNAQHSGLSRLQISTRYAPVELDGKVLITAGRSPGPKTPNSTSPVVMVKLSLVLPSKAKLNSTANAVSELQPSTFDSISNIAHGTPQNGWVIYVVSQQALSPKAHIITAISSPG